MDYIIVKENNNDIQMIERLEKIEIPSIKLEIFNMILKDIKFMKKFFDYKRDSTLALLNIYNAIIINEDNFNFNIEKKVRNWSEFFDTLKKYSKFLINESLNFYKKKERNILNNNYQLINENFISPIIEKIFEIIYINYLKKFPYWPNTPEIQNDYISLEFKNKIDINNIRYYWHFQGIIFIQDTKLDNKYNSFKVELKGNPKFEIVCVDLSKLNYLKKNDKNLKQYIDMIDAKIIDQNLQNLNLEFDF